MRIALCHHYSLTFLGGGERFLIDAAHQLTKRGHEVAIYALPLGKRPVNLVEQLQGIEYHENLIHNISDADVGYFIYAPLVTKLFRGRFPKIAGLHAFVFLGDLQHNQVRNMSRTEFIQEFGLMRFITNLYFESRGKNLDEFDAIHVINKQAQTLLAGTKRVYYVPNWIDASRFKPVTEKEEKFSVLFVGRKTKGFSTFVEIADLLKNQKMDFMAIGPDLHNTGSVKYLGLITDPEELVKLYSTVHALIYTSKIDVFPLTLLEAAACKLPIVAFSTRALEGLDLPLLYANSPSEFVKDICTLKDIWYEKPDEYFNLVENMRKAALEYDRDNVFPKFLSMLGEVASA